MNDNDRRFIGYAITECAKNKIKVILVPKKYVYTEGTKCAGYFDEDDRILVVATRKPQKDWLPILVHEFCHSQQWVEKEPLYIKITKNKKLDLMWDWLEGKDMPMSVVRKSIRAYQKMELDCEKRSVRHIKNFQLSIDMDEYIQLANIYVLFYSILLKTRKWYNKPPYRVKNLMKEVPKNFLKSYIKVPSKFEDMVMKNCF